VIRLASPGTQRSSFLAGIAGLHDFGSLDHLHGATPSERAFLGVLPKRAR